MHVSHTWLQDMLILNNRHVPWAGRNPWLNVGCIRAAATSLLYQLAHMVWIFTRIGCLHHLILIFPRSHQNVNMHPTHMNRLLVFAMQMDLLWVSNPVSIPRYWHQQLPISWLIWYHQAQNSHRSFEPGAGQRPKCPPVCPWRWWGIMFSTRLEFSTF